MDLSVIIPLYNEEESLQELTGWVTKVAKENQFSFEIIFINDGSNDNSWEVIEKLAKNNSSVKGIKFRRNYGKSAALHCGFEHVKGNVVITMDADLQDNPEEIPGLYKMIKDEGYHLVSGWKKKRYDPLTKTLPSKFFNFVAWRVSGLKLHDFNCGLKAYALEVVRSIEVYGEMHRYIPILVKQAGYPKIGERVVQHQERKYGVSKFGINRFINGFLDLLSLSFISRFAKKPMHFFGSLGVIIIFLGVLAALYIGFDKWYSLQKDIPAKLVADNPFLYIALSMMIIGVQLFLAGYIAELISRSSPERNTYQIEKKIKFSSNG